MAQYHRFKDAQVTVDQNHITITDNGLNWRFRHPPVRHIKGSFSIATEKGHVFFYSIMKMSRASDGTFQERNEHPVKFVFTDVTQWYNFYQALKTHGYTSPPSESSN